MEVVRISFYDAFTCAASDCKESCCRSWSIPLDAASHERYRSEKGLTGLLLRLAVRGKDEPLLNAGRGRCLFLQRDGLCALQVKKGADYPPYVCRTYPRKRTNYGVRAEEYLDLSCIEAAKLFLRAPFPLTRLCLQQEVSYGRHGDNLDAAYFARLSASCDALCGLFKETKRSADGVDEAMRCALSYAAHWQEVSARGQDPFADDTEVTVSGIRLFPLPVVPVNEWVNGCLWSEEMKRLLPFLHRLLQMYFKRFDRQSVAQGERILDALYRSFLASDLFDADKYKKYAVYFLYRYYPETYEDYSFVRRTRDAVMHTNLILLFDALWAQEKGTLSVNAQAHIIAVYEKRVFHNASLQKEMYAKWDSTQFALPVSGGNG